MDLPKAVSLFVAFAILPSAGACRTKANLEPIPTIAMTIAARMSAGTSSRPGMRYDLPYRLFVPPDHSKQRRYPLIVFLHPTGGNGTDNLRQLTSPVGDLIDLAQAVEPAFVLAPQCPVGDKWVNKAHGPPFRNYSQAERPQSEATRLVLAAIEDLEARYPIDPERVYLTGASSGGAGTWDLITRNGVGRFAAAVPITGANDPSSAPLISRLPIWAFHGAQDDLSPVANTREMVQALRALGSPVKYTEYAGVGHVSWERAYAEKDLYRWLLAQRRAAPTR